MENLVISNYALWEIFFNFDLKNHLEKFDPVITEHPVYSRPT